MNKWFKKYFQSEISDEFCSGVFSDELDKMGLNHQVVSGLRLNSSKLRFFGRIRTLTIETKETPDENISVGLGYMTSLNRRDVLYDQVSETYA